MTGSCPQCKGKLLSEVPKCPHCGYAPKAVPSDSAGQQAGNEWKKCPYCAEQIRAEAVVCRYCNREIQQLPLAVGPAPKTSEIVQQGTAKDAERRSIIAEVRRRRALARLMVVGCVVSALIAGGLTMESRRGSPTGVIFVFVAFVFFLAYFVARPRYTGAECPHCHSFAVRRGSRSGCVSASYFLKCQDCLSEFGGTGGGCSCLLLLTFLGTLASGLLSLILVMFLRA